ncbi:hypothetical protein COOONC_09935 [Cooperia oncophora]
MDRYGRRYGRDPPRSDSFSRLLGAPTPVAEEEKKESEGEEETQVEMEVMHDRGLQEFEIIFAEVDDQQRPPAKVNFELEISERTLVDHDSDSQTEGSRKGEMEVEEQEESVATIKRSEPAPDPEAEPESDEVAAASEDDSFVKNWVQIPLLGRPYDGELGQEGDLDFHLSEFMTSCKAPPPLEAVPTEWDTLSDIKSLLDGFSQKQGLFDKFVAEIREHGDNTE